LEILLSIKEKTLGSEWKISKGYINEKHPKLRRVLLKRPRGGEALPKRTAKETHEE